MNNAIFRSGHLQNVVALDDAVLDHVEVVYGPGSSIYGSDALGGVMHFYTKNRAWPGTTASTSAAWRGRDMLQRPAKAAGTCSSTWEERSSPR